MKTVIFDTNIVHDVYWFSQPKWKLLLNAIDTLPYELSIPRVVRDEILGHYRKSLESKSNDYRKALKAINYLSNNTGYIETADIDTEQLCRQYEAFFDKLSDREKVKILEYPDIPHEEIARRAILKKKPFKPNGSGYRDTLIWETIKRQLGIGKEIVFLTNNTKDFFNESSENLDKKLKFEVGKEAQITVYKSLEDFHTQELKPQYEQLEDFIEVIREDNQEGMTCADILFKLREELVDDTINYPFEDSFDDQTTVLYIEDLEIEDILSAVKLDENRLYIEGSYIVEMNVDYFVERIDAYTNEEASYGIEDYNWNDMLALVSKETKMNLSIDVVFNEKTEKIEEMNYIINEEVKDT